MRLSRQYAFVDDTGDTGLDFDKAGTSSHFILTAVIVDESSLAQVTSDVESVRSKHFQTGEMKSSGVGGKDDRRIRILRDLSDTDFHLLAIVVDKRRLHRARGLRYHDSFVKFLNSQIHRALFRAFPGVVIVADEHGDRTFMDGFADYITRQLKPNLFDDYSFSFDNSHSNVLLQLSDFMCGTIARGYELKRKSPRYKEFYRAIEFKVTAIQEWPRNYESYLVDLSRENPSAYDEEIARCAIRLADGYISEYEDSDVPAVRARVRFLELLLFRLRFRSPDIYISTNEILDALSYEGVCPQDRYYLRSEVVAPLRDRGVIISSSSKGYKIPVSERDLYDFANHSLGIIGPMVSRLRECREQIRLATRNRLDLFERPEYGILKKLLHERHG